MPAHSLTSYTLPAWSSGDSEVWASATQAFQDYNTGNPPPLPEYLQFHNCLICGEPLLVCMPDGRHSYDSVGRRLVVAAIIGMEVGYIHATECVVGTRSLVTQVALPTAPYNRNSPVVYTRPGSHLANLFHNYSWDVAGEVPMGVIPSRGAAPKRHPPLLLGVELETTITARTHTHQLPFSLATAEAIRNLARLLERHPYVGIKQDGSLHNVSTRPTIYNMGFEMVSAPMTLDFHQKLWPLMFSDPDFAHFEAREQCGLHVHMDRAAISPLTLGKMLAFINNPHMSDFISNVAGRPVTNRSQYCATRANTKITKVLDPDGERYRALNLAPSRTAEMRIFASTTDITEMLGRIEFCAALVDWCRTTSIRNMGCSDFREHVVKYEHRFPNLCRLLERLDGVSSPDAGA